MIQEAIFAGTGFIMNRIRGGRYKDRLKLRVGNKVISMNKLLNDFVFATLCTFAYSTHYVGVVDGVANYQFIDSFWWEFLIFFGAMTLGRGLGWGGYVGGMVDKIANRPEVPFIDKMVKKFEKDRDYVKRNTIALSVRGGIWGASLFAGFALTGNFTILPLVAGFLMGPVYLAVIELSDKLFSKRDHGWPYSEYVYGAVLWASVG